MENNKEYAYIQFPLCLIRETFRKGRSAIGLMLYYGIVSFAKKLPYDIQDVAHQVIYYYYRKPEILQSSIRRYIENNRFTYDEDYNGFTVEGDFYPAENAEEIISLFDDEEFKNDCILHYQLHLATSSDPLNIDIISNDYVIDCYKKALQIKDEFESIYGPDAMPFCPKSILFDFADNEKNDLDIFRALIGIRSLIGFKNYVATVRPVILMRMLGCKNKKALNDFINSCTEAKELFDKYTRSDKALRYHFDKLFATLLSRGFIKSKIFVRGISRKIFISIKLNHEQLAEEIIKFAAKRNFKKQENEAISKIRATI